LEDVVKKVYALAFSYLAVAVAFVYLAAYAASQQFHQWYGFPNFLISVFAALACLALACAQFVKTGI
jgi:FtsH-binding integral membrane protein